MNCDDITVVTTFSKACYERHAQLFTSSFDERWPEHIKLLVYSEDFTGPWVRDEKNSRIELLDLLAESDGCRNFLERHRDDPVIAGRAVNQPRTWGKAPRRDKYNFRFDAYKFCRKIFAIEAAAKRLKTGRLYWIDADTVTDQRVDLAALDAMLPPDKDIGYLGRQEGYHSECGFVAYRLPEAMTFIDAFAQLFSQDFFIPLAEWHDSWLFDQIRKMYPALRYRDHNTFENRRVRIFDMSPIGRFMIHLKGNMKDEEDLEWVVAARRRHVLQKRARNQR